MQRGDDVLFALVSSTTVPFLKLSGPTRAVVHQPITLTVTDGQTGSPIQNAVVNGQSSNQRGQVSITFPSAGGTSVKAENGGTIRSNRLLIDAVQ